jgi:bacteriocin-like protein
MKKEENKKQEELNEEQLDNVSGGCAGKGRGARIPW